MSDWMVDLLWLLLAALLVAANGFFVAAEFALVKMRASRIETLVDQGRPFARIARWLMQRLNAALSACQLGITMASLGLGWIGEPAFARLLKPVLTAFGIDSPALLHSLSFAVAFTLITVLHIVIGEQVPKIYAIRKPDAVILGSALPMKLFYYASYPLMAALNGASNFLLRRLGIGAGSLHDDLHSEKEIRALLHQAHLRGVLSRSEHHLLNAVFEFDDLVSRRVMIPRRDVVFLDSDDSLGEWLATMRRSRHTRYPVCEGSLDKVLGIAHIKDFVGCEAAPDFDRQALLRPAQYVPETMPTSRLLRHFQSTRQLMALVVDEYGNTIGAVTLENVLEQIVGSVEDEFDDELPEIVEEAPDRFLVRGGTPLEVVRRRLDVALEAPGVETFSGFLVAQAGKLVESGEKLELDELDAEILEATSGRVNRVRVTLRRPASADASE